jgi:hypothetical protein
VCVISLSLAVRLNIKMRALARYCKLHQAKTLTIVECGSVTLLPLVLSIRLMLEISLETTA